ncbi:MAG: MBL fold metallo-hydrolase [Candidatus Dormibacteria bacterium]
MEITWLGGSALLLKGREAKVLLAPEPGFGASVPGGAEVVVGALAPENQLRVENGPQVVARPGEYELRGVTVRGVATGARTLFVAQVDEVAVLDLADFKGTLDPDTLDVLGSLDVLAISVDGGAPGRAAEVAQLVAQLQPAVLLPVGFLGGGGEETPAGLEPLVKEMGLGQLGAQPRLNLSGSGGTSDETRVVVLEARS